jgi:hypothetical protein
VCIGAGAVHFIHVPGYIVSLHKRMDSEMRPISIVDSVTSDKEQEQIKKLLVEKYPALQVCFL